MVSLARVLGPVRSVPLPNQTVTKVFLVVQTLGGYVSSALVGERSRQSKRVPLRLLRLRYDMHGRIAPQFLHSLSTQTSSLDTCINSAQLYPYISPVQIGFGLGDVLPRVLVRIASFRLLAWPEKTRTERSVCIRKHVN
jgi:hypothetical protein